MQEWLNIFSKMEDK